MNIQNEKVYKFEKINNLEFDFDFNNYSNFDFLRSINNK